MAPHSKDRGTLLLSAKQDKSSVPLSHLCEMAANQARHSGMRPVPFHLVSSLYLRPVIGYCRANSYMPLRSSVTVQDIASDNRPSPFVVKFFSFTSNKIGFMFSPNKKGHCLSVRLVYALTSSASFLPMKIPNIQQTTLSAAYTPPVT